CALVIGEPVVLGHAFDVPDLETEPLVRRGVVPDGLFVVEHAVERGDVRRRFVVGALPAVGRTTCDTSVGGLQPLEELQLTVEAGCPVLGPCGRFRCHAAPAQGVGRHHVLVTLVGGGTADTPGPGGFCASQCAAAGLVPGEQVVGGVLARSG